MAQVVGRLPSKHEAMSLNPLLPKKFLTDVGIYYSKCLTGVTSLCMALTYEAWLCI
jgi:hypothetical protein